MIALIFFLIVIGVLLGVILPMIPMDANIRKIIVVIVILGVIFYVLQWFGLISGSALRLR